MKRNPSLTVKFLLIYAVMGITCFIMVSTLGSYLIERELIRYTSSGLYQEATNVASGRISFSRSSSATLEEAYENLSALAQYQDTEIWIISADGEVVLNTAVSPDETTDETIEGFDPIALGSGYYTVGTFFGSFDSDRLSVMVPVTSNLRIRGYVAIHLPMSQLAEEREEILSNIHLLFLVLFCIILFAILVLIVTVNRPLHKITRGAQEFASGNLSYQIRVRSHDELRTLADSLNYMASEVNKTGEYQRKFISNVSHDFRSPLTSIKGYVEAILDGTIPPEMQEKYLRIVLSETQRLNKLTQSMLTLNNIEKNGFYLEYTDFDLHQVIKDTIATFEGTCTAKQIRIELLLNGQTLPVHADLGRIQQVLYNLIDNAIKFSRNNSTIQIETTERHEKAYISVQDHGIGIPRASISKIWERFYKTDASRGKDRKGTGLGLSIVKEIIQAHGQKITVVSTEGAGTEFTFTLDTAKQGS